MSKIGKISINIPDKVKVALAGSDINIAVSYTHLTLPTILLV